MRLAGWRCRLVRCVFRVTGSSSTDRFGPLGRPRDRTATTAVQLNPWARQDVYRTFRARMDSLLRRRAIASARTNDSGMYQMPLSRRDSIELFAFTLFDDHGSLLIWRDRVPGEGTHDLPKPSRRMNHVYCGEP